MTVAELWEEYRPKLDAAKEADRRDVQLSMVCAPEFIGKSWVMPMTLGRLLFLDAINHPFLTGQPTDRNGVLDFLWIMSPQFSPGNRKAAKKFFRRYWFKEIDAGPLREYLAEEFADEGTSKEPDPTWIAQLVDVIASEYGWSEREIFDIPLKRIFRYSEAIVARRSDSKTINFTTPKTDAVRNDYLRKVRSIQQAEAPREETPAPLK